MRSSRRRRRHHVRLKDLDATSDSGTPHLVLAVRSDLSIEEQINATGETWLDRRLIATERLPLSDLGFDREVRDAMEARADHLGAEALAHR
ncbi:DUF3363 domain-containing protein [Methylocystis iwaonis]|uniref:DUF3363 domain-containing protein n=1 Tax=Methylocystis iwaonis TaxID=2885079 RepID=UPI0024904E97|nr:DUF3363 domain-containing protein [Methylocystis iwaonis]